MSLIETLLKELQSVGVHYIKNINTVMLEILNDTPHKITEIDRLIHDLISCIPHNNIKKIKLECPRNLLNHLKYTKAKMNIVGERVIFTKNLAMQQDFSVPHYEVWQPFTYKSISFLSEILQKSYNETEIFLKQMSEELPSQAEKMYTVYKMNNEPIGVVFPHIEPRTDQEGRMFWIGIHPRYLGRKLGKDLHAIGLHRLKNDFKAKSYLGITQIDNEPMKKIMIANECIQHENTLISLDYISEG